MPALAQGILQYGIFSPTLGLREDMPSILLPQAMTPDCQNIHIRYGEVRRAKMRSSLLARTPSPYNPILHYHWLEKSDGSAYLFAFTKDEIYKWNTATGAWDAHSDYGGGGTGQLSDTTEWSTVTFNDQVIATNNVDMVLIGDNATAFDKLDDASGLQVGASTYVTKAKWVDAFENYVLVGNVTEGGSACRQRVRWSDLGDETNWQSGDADYLDVPGPDILTGTGHFRDQLMLFKTDSVYRMWLTAGDLIFNNAAVSTEIGCEAPQSIINGKDGDLYFFATDKSFRGMRAGEISRPIDPTVKGIPNDYMYKIRGLWVQEYDELWWAIPDGAAATANNKIVCMGNGIWTVRDVAVEAFGTYKHQQNYTWDDLPYNSWDEWDWDSWDSVEGAAGFPTDIGSDSSGYTYALHQAATDNGAAYTGYLVLTTDLANRQALNRYKRLLNMRLYFKSEVSGTISVSLKRDHEADWQTVGTVSLIDTAEIIAKELPCDYRARHFLLKLSASNKFAFLGVIFDFIYDGTD